MPTPPLPAKSGEYDIILLSMENACLHNLLLTFFFTVSKLTSVPPPPPFTTSTPLHGVKPSSVDSSYPISSSNAVSGSLIQPAMPYYMTGKFNPYPVNNSSEIKSTSTTHQPTPPPPPNIQNPTAFGQSFVPIPPPMHQAPPPIAGHPQPPQSLYTQPPLPHIPPIPSHIQNLHPHTTSHGSTSAAQTHIPADLQHPSNQAYNNRLPVLPPHKLYPSMHHQGGIAQPPPLMPQNTLPNMAAGPGGNNMNWHINNFTTRPSNSRNMTRGGWMR